MNEEQWVLNRAGIINFWYYDVAYFDFADGKLLLRGANGSGKSVTMSSLITVLLDGRKTPDRLDPFGSSARRMEDYLLGEEDVSGRSERTGYLFLEYRRRGMNQYITTGMGMQARRHKSMNTWYFVMTDNRRIGIDLELYRTSGDEVVPLSRQELSNRIRGGQVTTSQREYMALVNELIFGFDNIDLYDDLIKLLIQLRRPKLSKDFKPTVIYDILQQSLPALKDDDLHSVADTLEQIDQARQQLDQAKDEHRLMTDVTAKYLKYYEYCIKEMAAHFDAAAKKLQGNRKQLQKNIQEQSALKEQLSAYAEEEKQLQIKIEVLTREHEELQKHEVFKLVSEKGRLIKEEKIQSDKLARLEEKLRNKMNQVNEQKEEIEKQEWELENLNKAISGLKSEMAELSSTAGFSEHHDLLGDYERQAEQYDFQAWKQKMKDYAAHLRQISSLFSEYEQKREEVHQEDKRLGDQCRVVADLDMEIRDLNQVYTDERDKLMIQLQKWRESLHFSIGDTNWAELLRGVAELYDGMTLFDEALRPARESKEAAEKVFRVRDAEVSQKLESERELKQDLEARRSDWVAKKDPEPERSEETRAFRSKLAVMKIDARPFYELIDFAPDTPQPVRNHIEAALLETGYLDALVSEKDLELEADKQLKPKPLLFAQTLGQFLVPDCPAGSEISAETVQSVIDSIQLEGENSLIINESGAYRLPSLEGRASGSYEAAYIGKASREAYRRREIERLTLEIDETGERIAGLEKQREEIAESIRTLDEDMARKPEDVNLRFAYDERNKKIGQREQENRFKEQIERQLEQKKREEGTLRTRLNELTESDPLPLTREAYRQADRQFSDYQEAFDEFKTAVGKIRNTRHLIALLNKEIALKQEDYEDTFREMNDCRTEAERLSKSLESIEARLKLKSADEVRRRMETVIRDLDQSKNRLPAVTKASGIAEKSLEQLDEKIRLLEREVQFFDSLRAAWEESFLTTYKRYLPEDAAIRDLAEVVREELKDFNPDIDRKKRLASDFETRFREVQGSLLEYRLEINDRKIVTESEWTSEKWPDDLAPRLEQWRTLSHQQLFECDYQGTRTTPQFVLAKLKEYIDTQSVVLEEQDQRLFEDIILHSVGVTLRSLIDRSGKWVDQMNRILMAQENSSDLMLSIAWKPKAAESEEELDTLDLVSLLRRDQKLLTQDDLEKMIRHFRSKINACKQQMLDEDNTQPLDQVLKEVLDYRKWFTFEISYKKKTETKKELTNTRFYKFSGGEKAISMYLPLYTAVFARYQDAGRNAPRIIALDEAFAGVDELNIAEQFKAIEQLGFNYMMNSQALFGDYATVSALNIYELIRPKDADFVSVIAYHWNGRERQLIENVEEESVLSEN